MNVTKLLPLAQNAGPIGVVLAALYALVHELTGFDLSDVTLMILFSAIMSVQSWYQSRQSKDLVPVVQAQSIGKLEPAEAPPSQTPTA